MNHSDLPIREQKPLRVSEAVAMLGVSAQTIRRFIKSQKIRASKPGHYLIPVAEVKRLQLAGDAK
jgi:excisionase family DNA binding protein